MSGEHDTQEPVMATGPHSMENHRVGLFVRQIDNDLRPDGEAPRYLVANWMSGCRGQL